jgi:hypothetical protein
MTVYISPQLYACGAAYIFGRGIIGEWTEHLGLSCFRTKSLFDILISVEVLCVSFGFSVELIAQYNALNSIRSRVLCYGNYSVW